MFLQAIYGLLIAVIVDKSKVAVGGVDELSWFGEEGTRPVQQGAWTDTSRRQARRKYVSLSTVRQLAWVALYSL